jgi:O-antigen/teichoic acid export membrane protein
MIFGLVYWISPNKEKDFDKEVDELWNNKFIRFTGVVLALTSIISAIFFFSEIIFSSKEYPPQWDEFPMLILGAAILSTGVYTIFVFFAWIYRKIFTRKKSQPDI